MLSNNFQPLKPRWEELYQHACFAELYVYSDPQTATIKLRCFVEAMVGILYRELNLRSEPGDKLVEKIQASSFEEIVGSPICQKLHAVRVLGNKAAHGGKINTEQSLQLLKEAYLLGQWLYKTYSGEIYDDYPDFVVTKQNAVSIDDLQQANAQLAKQLVAAKQELVEVQAAQLVVDVVDSPEDQLRREKFRNDSSSAAKVINLDEESTRRLLSVEDAFAAYSLNDGQSELVKKLSNFLSGNSESVFLLKGYAGTGKTFITKGLTEYFRSIGRNYVLAAPTGKASKVIAEKTRSPAFTIHRTIYSFKDIAEYRDDDLEGTETYKMYAQLAVNEMSADTVFIVDEASMFADIYSEAEFFRCGTGYLLTDFLKFVNLDHNDHRKKVIFIGDDAQLPPVGMNFSPALSADYLYKKHGVTTTNYELTEVVRQKADSGVMLNSIKLRKAIFSGVFNQLSVDFDYPDVDKIEHLDLMSRYLAACDGKINGEAIVIAHSNADVSGYNRKIRAHFFPDCPQVVDGDKVMAVSNSNAYGFFISNGDFGQIKRVLGNEELRSVTLRRKNADSGELEEVKITLMFRDVFIGFRDLEGNSRFFEAKILEDLLYSEHAAMSSDENKALYLDFCIRHKDHKRGSLEFKNTLMADPYFNALRLKFGYAITCHKAQGSEWNQVFVKCKVNQSQLSSAYFRWFYTAITRTSKNLYLLDPPNIKLGSGIKSIQSPGIGFTTGTTKAETPAAAAGAQPVEVSFGEKVASEPVVPELKEQKTEDEASRLFGIPSSSPFLLGLLLRVRQLIEVAGIRVDDIVHNQYQEVFSFVRGEEISIVDIRYNGKEKVVSLTARQSNPFTSEVLDLLAPLKGMPIASSGVKLPASFSFEEDFLNELHHRIMPLADEQGITIHNVEKLQWNLRYTFMRDNEVAVYDIYFNSKNSFKKCQAIPSACSPGFLVGDVNVLLTEGLSA
ncbi:AAA family ATPase [Pseudomonadales bacterium]|nr:AAA family ATPase [Pseudomonadales bacterium]